MFLKKIVTNHALIERAAALAARAHSNQTRKESSAPYIAHPIAVALILARRGFSDTVVAAALAHDVIEDTDIADKELRDELGDDVADLIVPITHDSCLSWEEKKIKYIEAVRNASNDAKAISVADKIANARSLLAAHKKQGAAVWKCFNAGREKKLWFERAMLDMLRASWKHPLVDEYAELVARMDKLR